VRTNRHEERIVENYGKLNKLYTCRIKSELLFTASCETT